MKGIESPFPYLRVRVEGNEMNSRELIPLYSLKISNYHSPKN